MRRFSRPALPISGRIVAGGNGTPSAPNTTATADDLDTKGTGAGRHRRRGELLQVAKHPVFEQYAKASKSLRDDPDAGRLLQQFEQKAMVLSRNEQMGQPVAERQELEQMQQTIACVKAFSIAQADMTDMFRKVSQAWQKPVAKRKVKILAPGCMGGPSPISLG